MDEDVRRVVNTRIVLNLEIAIARLETQVKAIRREMEALTPLHKEAAKLFEIARADALTDEEARIVKKTLRDALTLTAGA